jgi:uncharacterized tellurite resistance protein B-like protein
MLDALKRLLEGGGAAPAPAPSATGDDRDHRLRVATAALLYEVVRADGAVADSERTVMNAAVRSTFDLTPEDEAELVRLGEEASSRSVSLYEFTRVLRESASADERRRVVELLWLVAFADTRKDALEEHMIRKIAGLLDVAQPDFIAAKQRARAAQDAPRG